MSSETLALWFSNYASLATKALKPGLAATFEAVAHSLDIAARKVHGGTDRDQNVLLARLDALSKDCTANAYPQLKENSGANRGALRAYTWGNKTMTILKSVIGRVITKGDAVLAAGQAFYVCDACGFIFVGNEAPAVCPVCKAPAARFVRY